MKGFEKLQKVGKALMTPVSVLPAAGILVALGRLLQDQSGFAADAGKIMFDSGISIFENLALIFAIGVAIGFAGEAVAALAAGVGYSVFAKVMGSMAGVINIAEKTGGNIESIDTGVFGGIVVGIIAANIYKKFHKTKLPPFLGFFAGKRLVPILTAVAAVVAGVVLSFVWPPIQIKINEFAKFAMASPIGPALYAAGKRALIPVGLHHVYYPPFLYEFGRFTTEAGDVLRGEAARYFAGDVTAGRFMAAEYPLMLFGLPAACLAMYLRAKDKVKVAGMLFTAAITSFVTGITEPIEFLFIFVAPLLYVFHVIAAFVSGLLTNYFGVRLGYTFSASAIDYALGFSNAGNPMKFWLIVGPIIAILYFTVFYVTIPLFNFQTPGRSNDEEEGEGEKVELSTDERVYEILKALGGSDNLDDVDACITRLRLQVKDNTIIDESKLKSLGASGVMKAGNSVQVVFGPESDVLKDEIKAIMQGGKAC